MKTPIKYIAGGSITKEKGEPTEKKKFKSLEKKYYTCQN